MMDAAVKTDKPETAATPAARAVPSPSVQPDAKPATPAVKPVATKPAAKTAAPKPALPRQAAAGKPKAKPAVTIAASRKAASATKEPIMDIKTTTDKAQALLKDATDRAKGTVDKSQKTLGEMNDFGKGNIEAIVESSKIAARGIETMSQDALAYAKKSFEDATATAKTLASAKSPTEFVKLQSDYVRTSFDALIAHGSRSTEAMLKLAGEVAQPISNRFALAAEKVKVAA